MSTPKTRRWCWATLARGATVFAVLPGAPNKAVIFGYEKGRGNYG